MLKRLMLLIVMLSAAVLGQDEVVASALGRKLAQLTGQCARTLVLHISTIQQRGHQTGADSRTAGLFLPDGSFYSVSDFDQAELTARFRRCVLATLVKRSLPAVGSQSHLPGTPPRAGARLPGRASAECAPPGTPN